MEKYQFKTNINCGGCVAKVTPQLNSHSNIKKWDVDFSNPDKVLTVEAEGVTADEVKDLVKTAGFSATEL